jgi:hypothetical protein
MKFTRILLIVLITVMAMGTFACSRPPQEDIIAEVGGHPITATEFAEYYQVRPMLDQMIWEDLVILECEKRGIALDEMKYEESVNMFVEQRGGKEATKEWMDANGIRWADIFYYSKMQILQQQLTEDEIGEPSEEEMLGLWEEKKDRYKQALSGQLGVLPEEITMDDVRDQIITEWRTAKQSTVFTDLKEKLKGDYNVINYFTLEGVEMKEIYDEATETKAIKDLGEEEEKEESAEAGH